MNDTSGQKLRLVVEGLPPAAAFALGLVMAAHANRAHRRKKEKAARATLREAERNQCLPYGGFADESEAASRWQSDKQGAHRATLAARVSAEKFYKKLKNTFLEEFPEHRAALIAVIPQ
jgi:hypothetical protein